MHVNLFISFMLRALATLLKDSLMPGGALEKDLITGPNNLTYFDEDSDSVSIYSSLHRDEYYKHGLTVPETHIQCTLKYSKARSTVYPWLPVAEHMHCLSRPL